MISEGGLTLMYFKREAEYRNFTASIQPRDFKVPFDGVSAEERKKILARFLYVHKYSRTLWESDALNIISGIRFDHLPV